MPVNPPDRVQLLDAVLEFLAGDGSAGDDAMRTYERRVAVNLLRIIRRELVAADALLDEECARLTGLLAEQGDAVALNARLCERIRNRDIDIVSAPLLDHLRRTTLAKLAIDNPRYCAYVRALGAASRD